MYMKIFVIGTLWPPPPSPGLRFSWFWEIAFLFGLSRYFGWLCSNRIFIRACYAKRWDKFYFKRPNSNSIRTYLGSSSCRLSQKIHRHRFFFLHFTARTLCLDPIGIEKSTARRQCSLSLSWWFQCLFSKSTAMKSPLIPRYEKKNFAEKKMSLIYQYTINWISIHLDSYMIWSKKL